MSRNIKGNSYNVNLHFLYNIPSSHIMSVSPSDQSLSLFLKEIVHIKVLSNITLIHLYTTWPTLFIPTI